METKKEFFVNVWPEVYASRQNRSILKWPVTGVEEHTLRFREGEEKVFCLVVSKERVKGLIPLQESGIDPGPNKAATRGRLITLLGQEVEFVVTNIDLENEQFLASRKAALERLVSRAWSGLKEGDVKTCTARRVFGKSVIVEIDGIEGILPASEISYGWVDEIFDVIQPGDVFDVKIKKLDHEKKRLVVSVKDMIPNPWPDAARRYAKNAFYRGVVTGVTNYGIFVELEPGVNALLRHMRSAVPQKGDEIALVITRIDTRVENGQPVGRIRGTPVRILRRAAATG